MAADTLKYNTGALFVGALFALGVLGGTIFYSLAESRKKEIESQPLFRAPLEYKVDSHPVDQVFMTFNGYSVLYANENGEVIEKKYRDDSDGSLPSISSEKFRRIRANPNRERHLRVFRDLPKGDRGELATVIYRFKDGPTCVYRDCTYTEIHLPLDGRIFPGIDSNSDVHNQVYQPMQEIK